MSLDLYNPRLNQLIEMQYPGKVPDHVARLHLMENPYSLPEEVHATIQQKLSQLPLNRYPETNLSSLKQKLRDTFSIPNPSEILLGNGSFELLQNLFITLNHPKHCFLTPAPSFFFFQRSAHLLNQPIITVPLLKNSFLLDMPAMLAAIKKHQPSLILIDNPNNPMGSAFEIASLQKIVEAAPGLVLIDEAYQQYAKTSMMPYLSQYSNLIISRSFSKHGLAGIRLGYFCCHPDVAKQMNKVALPFNINALTLHTIEVILDHFKILESQTEKIIQDRNTLYQNMKNLLGDNVLSSATNFINFIIPHCHTETAFKQFLAQGVLLYFYRMKPGHPLHNHLRVTVGTPKENKRFLSILKDIHQLSLESIPN